MHRQLNALRAIPLSKRIVATSAAGIAIVGCGDAAREMSRAEAEAQLVIVTATNVDGFDQCPRPPARTFSTDSVVQLAGVGRFPCRVAAVSVARLEPSADASRPDPAGFHVVQDSRGRFVSNAAMAYPGRVLVWDPNGSFLRTLGQPGEGPGELPGIEMLGLHLDAHDSLHVVGMNRWSVFDHEFTFSRRVYAPAATTQSTARNVTDQGFIVSGGLRPNRRETDWFYIADRQGHLVRSFGPSPRGGEERPAGAVRRSAGFLPVAYGGGDTFWFAYPAASRGTYYLEEWTLEGQLLRTFQRDASWFAPLADDEPYRAIVPPFRALHVDPDGVLWVVATVRKPGVILPTDPDDATPISEIWEYRYEAIDLAAGAILASGLATIPSSGQPGAPVLNMIPRTNRAYRSVVDSMGFDTIEIFDLRLVTHEIPRPRD